jgi:tetratricopeptide (TPR) repeat protein
VEVLMKLDRLDEAADLVRPLASGSVVAMMTLAAIERDREHWTDSDAAYEAALVRILPDVAKYPQARSYARLVFEGLASNAQRDHRPQDGERALRRGLEALPEQAATFHYLLGRHYSDGGRPTLALEHFREAARLDPGKYQAISDQQIRELRTHTPACFP